MTSNMIMSDLLGMNDMVPKASNEFNMILEGLKELFDKLNLVNRFEINRY